MFKSILQIIFFVLGFSSFVFAEVPIQPQNDFGEANFIVPIQGEYGNDYIIVNYVDWGQDTLILDYNCLNKTYNGHQGTDFVIRDFSAMDEGVNVVAVDSGTVFYVQDGIFDREKESVISKQLGNFIGIKHKWKIQTYYAHLKKNSIIVAPGDVVVPGQVIGQVGSSGNSSSPHLHFEMWYDSTYYIDPFMGNCGNNTTYWRNAPKYDSTFNVWTSGILNFKPNLDTLKENLMTIDTIKVDDESISYWALLYGLRKNDSLRIEWYSPQNQLWFTSHTNIVKDWWYYYYWSFINVPVNSGDEGVWNAKFFRNNMIVNQQSFYFSKNTSSVKTTLPKDLLKVYQHQASIAIKIEADCDKIKLIDLKGNFVKEIEYHGGQCVIEKQNMQTGVYFVVALHNDKIIATKKIIF